MINFELEDFNKQIKDAVTKYEISQHAFNFCQQREKERLHYKMDNVFEESSSYFDLIMAIDVVEHVENCFEFLRNLKIKGEWF